MSHEPSPTAVDVDALNHILGVIEAFRAFDSDSDGSINAQELGGIMASLGYNVTEREVQSLMHGEGLLSLAEFVEMNTQSLQLSGLGPLKAAIRGLNMQENDVVTAEELHRGVCELGVELSLDDCREIVGAMDGDGDGAVSVDELNLIVDSLV